MDSRQEVGTEFAAHSLTEGIVDSSELNSYGRLSSAVIELTQVKISGPGFAIKTRKLVGCKGSKMGQFRWLAAVALIWASAASASNLGKFFVTLNNVETQLTFVRDARLGSYILSSDQSAFEMVLQGQAPDKTEKSKPVVKNVSFKMRDIEEVIVGISRKGDEAEIQFYTVVLDPNLLLKVPITETRKITLKPGQTWAQFEAGQSIEAVISDAREDEESRLTLGHLGAAYFDLVIRELLTSSGASLTNPIISVMGTPQRTIILSQKQITLQTRGGSLEIQTDVLAPTVTKPKGLTGGVKAVAI